MFNNGKHIMFNKCSEILCRVHRFTTSEDGAVTVDWVVLTAAIVGLGIAINTTIGGVTTDHADRIDNTMQSRGIATY